MKVKEGIFQSNIASCNHKVAGSGGGGEGWGLGECWTVNQMRDTLSLGKSLLASI